MLTQLERIHSQLREAIAELAALTREAVPDEAALPAARLKLSKLSSRRRTLLLSAVYPAIRTLPTADTTALSDLALDDIQLRGSSSNHIGRWTMRAIRADWPGYQCASAEIRAAMLGRISREAAVLYPLLRANADRMAA